MQPTATTIYELLASLVDYPLRGYRRHLQDCMKLLEEAHPEAARELQAFAGHAKNLDFAQLEEIYTHTFDINPVCSLEVGWQLYGEDYARGAFLVKMRNALRRWNIPESTELPDHLTQVLHLLGRMDHQEADELARSSVIPAIEKMIEGFSGKDSPYENVLKAIRLVLHDRHVRSDSEGKRND